MSRPVLIDEADGKCEICTKWKEPINSDSTSRFCNDCGNKIPDMLNMAGSGYQSPKPNHFHVKPVQGTQGREAIFSELCADCYLTEFSKIYPDHELPESVLVNAANKDVFSKNSE